MTLNMYSASVPVFTRMLSNLLNWLVKAAVHAQAKKFDVNVILSCRLAPDMLPFTKQIQICCDGAKFGVARLAGIEAPVFDDKETTMLELKERIAKTLAFVQSVPPSQIEGTESKEIAVPRKEGTMVMKGEPYLMHFVLPNFYFHLTTAYALLRHNGVELGKKDFLGL